mmetsp:Transcript_40105/g.106151  ORF Transcript_40105/g.106151 Transcript_40105/m.106151 type:complete len:338 (+) Transcript_40105:68-1081(+)
MRALASPLAPLACLALASIGLAATGGPPPTLVLAEDVAAYQSNGQVITRGVLNRTEMVSVAGSLTRLMKEHGQTAFSDAGGQKEVRFTFAIHELDKDVASFVADKKGELWRAARELAGSSDLCVLMDRGFSKDPGDLETHWHRDDEAIGLPELHPSLRTVHGWIPLSAMGREMGTLQYLQRSQRRVFEWYERLLASLWGWDFALFVSSRTVQDDKLQLGDIAWHDGWVMHSAGSNEAKAVRDGLAISFAYCPGPGNCRGAAAQMSADDVSCRITKQLFDENWKARHRSGEADYMKTALTEPLSVRATRFVFRSAVGAAIGLGVHWAASRWSGKEKPA